MKILKNSLLALVLVTISCSNVFAMKRKNNSDLSSEIKRQKSDAQPRILATQEQIFMLLKAKMEIDPNSLNADMLQLIYTKTCDIEIERFSQSLFCNNCDILYRSIIEFVTYPKTLLAHGVCRALLKHNQYLSDLASFVKKPQAKPTDLNLLEETFRYICNHYSDCGNPLLVFHVIIDAARLMHNNHEMLKSILTSKDPANGDTLIHITCKNKKPNCTEILIDVATHMNDNYETLKSILTTETLLGQTPMDCARYGFWDEGKTGCISILETAYTLVGLEIPE